MTHTLVVATHNHGKLSELRALLAPLGLQVLSAQEVTKREIVVVEDGDTFEANAKKKARTVAGITMMLTVADDSGLEVDALGGAPGVRSARFAGEHATDAENNAALLAALGALDAHPAAGAGSVATGRYAARFRCVLALALPLASGGEPFVVEGTCEGEITRTPRGSGGFGYDPLFLVGGTDKTMAELSEEEKNGVSHRARAVEKLRVILEEVLAGRDRDSR